jgi:hypothetical protein
LLFLLYSLKVNGDLYFFVQGKRFLLKGFKTEWLGFGNALGLAKTDQFISFCEDLGLEVFLIKDSIVVLIEDLMVGVGLIVDIHFPACLFPPDLFDYLDVD